MGVWWKSMMQCRTERKRSTVRRTSLGKLASHSKAQYLSEGGRIGDGVGTKFLVLTRGGLSASDARASVVIEDARTR
jgi:hypothetical protein